MISPRLGADTSSPTDMTDDASDSVGDMSITSKDSGESRDYHYFEWHLLDVLINVDFLYTVIVECLRPASPRLYFCDRVEFLPDSDSLESKRGFLSTTHFSTLLKQTLWYPDAWSQPKQPSQTVFRQLSTDLETKIFCTTYYGMMKSMILWTI